MLAVRGDGPSIALGREFEDACVAYQVYEKEQVVYRLVRFEVRSLKIRSLRADARPCVSFVVFAPFCVGSN